MQYRIEIHTAYGNHYSKPEDAAPDEEQAEHLRDLLEGAAFYMETADGYVIVPTREIRSIRIAPAIDRDSVDVYGPMHRG